MHAELTSADLLYKPTEVAEALKISKSKAYELIAAGDIEAVRVGALLRVPHASLTAYINGLRQPKSA